MIYHHTCPICYQKENTGVHFCSNCGFEFASLKSLECFTKDIFRNEEGFCQACEPNCGFGTPPPARSTQSGGLCNACEPNFGFKTPQPAQPKESNCSGGASQPMEKVDKDKRKFKKNKDEQMAPEPEFEKITIDPAKQKSGVAKFIGNVFLWPLKAIVAILGVILLTIWNMFKFVIIVIALFFLLYFVGEYFDIKPIKDIVRMILELLQRIAQ